MSYKEKRQSRITSLINEAISRVDQSISKQNFLEDLTPTKGVNIKVKDLATMDADKVSKIADKTTVNVVAEAEVDNVSVDNTVETPEQEKIKQSPQEVAIFNLENWANDLKLNIGEAEESVNNVVKFGYYEGDQYIAILVFPTGVIKVSGHVVQDFDDFENIVNFHKDL